jgi:hypothetical protein
MSARGLPEVDELHATSGRDGPLPQGLARRTEPDGRSRKSRLYARAHRCEAGKQVKEPCAARWADAATVAWPGGCRTEGNSGVCVPVAVSASLGEGDWVALQAAARVAGLAEVPTRRDVAATRRRESTTFLPIASNVKDPTSGHSLAR